MQTALLPANASPRSDALDIIRGVAILGIFFVNLGAMGVQLATGSDGTAGVGSPADHAVAVFTSLFLEGTQRGMLQMLFGAGVVIATSKYLGPGAPIEGADLFYRRHLWLLVFGLMHVLVFLWPYDILHVYAFAALFLFPFRHLGAGRLLALGSIFAFASMFVGSGGAGVEALKNGGLPTAAFMEPARNITGYAAMAYRQWLEDAQGFGLWLSLLEAFSTMLLGMALYKAGIIQGTRSRSFYSASALAAYAIAVPLRLAEAGPGADEFASRLASIDAAGVARVAMTLGHLATINLALTTRAGKLLTLPLKAVGRVALSLYFVQTAIGVWLLFSPFGLLPHGGLGGASLAAIALAVSILQIVLANLWLRRFFIGPAEWLWRSLTQRRGEALRSASHCHRPGKRGSPQRSIESTP